MLLIYHIPAGVLLRMLQMEGNLDGVSHVFVDEVRVISNRPRCLSPMPPLLITLSLILFLRRCMRGI
jgi:hypothetical protein